MNLRKNIPTVFDEDYLLSFQEQTIIVELSIIHDFLLEQLRMPMVTEMEGGKEVISYFLRWVGAGILLFWRAGLLTEEFYESHKDILDEHSGVHPELEMNTMEVYHLAYDFNYVIHQYLVVLGHDPYMSPKQDAFCNDVMFFTPCEVK